jgi:hypothetical protein
MSVFEQTLLTLSQSCTHVPVVSFLNVHLSASWQKPLMPCRQQTPFHLPVPWRYEFQTVATWPFQKIMYQRVPLVIISIPVRRLWGHPKPCRQDPMLGQRSKVEVDPGCASQNLKIVRQRSSVPCPPGQAHLVHLRRRPSQPGAHPSIVARRSRRRGKCSSGHRWSPFAAVREAALVDNSS